MELFDEYKMKNGCILVNLNGCSGEEDFYLMNQIIEELLKPEDSGYSVDSMCVGGYLKKDGILIRTSSESPYDGCSFYYDPAPLSEAEIQKVKDWNFLTQKINGRILC